MKTSNGNCPFCRGTGKIPIEEIAKEKEEALADIVEVVRCRDCKYCTKEIKWNGEEYLNCERAAELADNGVEIDGNQFCSYGERREG